MIENPADRAAMQHVVKLSAEIEFQLMKATGGGPVLALLDKARSLAANAITALAEVDAEKPAEIRALQNEVVCFRLICAWLKEIVADGYDADIELSDDDREDLLEAVGITDDAAGEQLRAGLPPADH